MSNFNINLHETIFLLSDALNLVGGNKIDHGKRVAFMATECATALNWPTEIKDDLFLASLLHDCGVSKTVIYDRMASFEGSNAGNHCSRGAQLLSQSPPLAYLSDCILHHHVDWEELKGIDLPDQLKLLSNCINLFDEVDFLSIAHQKENANILVSKDKIRDWISKRSNGTFNPQLVEVFLEISKPESFWLALDKGYNSGYARSWKAHKTKVDIEFADLKSIVQIYSRMVDAKSYYTKGHSEGVASLSRYLGELFELTEHDCDQLELAGLLHDLGKLRIPDNILDKPDILDEAEVLVMKRHSYDTYDILKDIHGFENIATWASQHHERLDGSGYPFQYDESNLSLEARIIAVADVFQSYTQSRPHREKLHAELILGLLRQQMHEGRLDKDVVLMVEENLADCWKIAVYEVNN